MLKSEFEIIECWDIQHENPVVSICCMVFNHEQFLEETFNGFLSQETDFRFEIVINDDCSTDNSHNIIEKYKKLYPNIIRTFKSEQNEYTISPTLNIVKNIGRCRGKYVAYCDGDDFWIATDKLQKQVNFLNNNEGYVAVSHNNYIEENGQLTDKLQINNEDITFTREDLLLSNTYMPTSSILFRNIIEFPNEIYSVNNFDHFLCVLFGQYGLTKNFGTFIGGVRRIIQQGIWSGANSFKRKIMMLNLYYHIHVYFSQKCINLSLYYKYLTFFEFFLPNRISVRLHKILRFFFKKYFLN
jgi:glycosyltransferase involved in cell wall biosynthesis